MIVGRMAKGSDDCCPTDRPQQHVTRQKCCPAISCSAVRIYNLGLFHSGDMQEHAANFDSTACSEMRVACLFER